MLDTPTTRIERPVTGSTTGTISMYVQLSDNHSNITHSSIALDVCGESVEAVFRSWLEEQITEEDYPWDIPSLLNQVCHQFGEDKKDCGHPDFSVSSQPWRFRVPGLRANEHKHFLKDWLQVSRYDWSVIQHFKNCTDS